MHKANSIYNTRMTLKWFYTYLNGVWKHLLIFPKTWKFSPHSLFSFSPTTDRSIKAGANIAYVNTNAIITTEISPLFGHLMRMQWDFPAYLLFTCIIWLVLFPILLLLLIMLLFCITIRVDAALNWGLYPDKAPFTNLNVLHCTLLPRSLMDLEFHNFRILS